MLNETATVFAVFYAIMFGGQLTRLSPWSAFGRDNRVEPLDRARRRQWWSLLFLTVLPALYFMLGLGISLSVETPWAGRMWTIRGVVLSAIWAVGLFLSVLAINALYRFWVAVILKTKCNPNADDIDAAKDDSRAKTVRRLVELGPREYLIGGFWSALKAGFGLMLLVLLRYLS